MVRQHLRTGQDWRSGAATLMLLVLPLSLLMVLGRRRKKRKVPRSTNRTTTIRRTTICSHASRGLTAGSQQQVSVDVAPW